MTADRELRASRARLVEVADAERKRIQRNLHDGAQQRLTSVLLSLGRLRASSEQPSELLEFAIDELAAGLDEIRKLASGLHPALLTERGLAPALEALALRAPSRSSSQTVPDRRLPEQIEAAAYYVVAEALANVQKHAGARRVVVRAATDGRPRRRQRRRRRRRRRRRARRRPARARRPRREPRRHAHAREPRGRRNPAGRRDPARSYLNDGCAAPTGALTVGSALNFRLLGPLEVDDDGGAALAIGTGRQRALLGLLVLRANELVASDRLVEELWGASPPADRAQDAAQPGLGAAAGAGLNGRLETLGSAYRLNVAPGERDVDRFEELVRAGGH